MSKYDYINNHYNLDVRQGTLLKFQGKECRVIGKAGPHLKVVRLEDGKEFLIHPKWEVKYKENDDDEECSTPVP